MLIMHVFFLNRESGKKKSSLHDLILVRITCNFYVKKMEVMHAVFFQSRKSEQKSSLHDLILI